ncbi:MAG: hypothetical protein ISR55_02395 [Bacteroidetes bacterium]|nr:hypothetical protein [Bacteroidota bacterium]
MHFLNRINFIDHETFENMKSDSVEISKQISSFITYLQKYNKK